MNHGNIEFRKVSGFKRGTLFELLSDAYSFDERWEDCCASDWKEFDHFFFDNPQIADQYGFITVLNGKAVGLASWDPRKMPEYVEIGHNCIISSCKGHGYGRMQLREALQRIVKRNSRITHRRGSSSAPERGSGGIIPQQGVPPAEEVKTPQASFQPRSSVQRFMTVEGNNIDFPPAPLVHDSCKINGSQMGRFIIDPDGRNQPAPAAIRRTLGASPASKSESTAPNNMQKQKPLVHQTIPAHRKGYSKIRRNWKQFPAGAPFLFPAAFSCRRHTVSSASASIWCLILFPSVV